MRETSHTDEYARRKPTIRDRVRPFMFSITPFAYVRPNKGINYSRLVISIRRQKPSQFLMPPNKLNLLIFQKFQPRFSRKNGKGFPFVAKIFPLRYETNGAEEDKRRGFRTGVGRLEYLRKGQREGGGIFYRRFNYEYLYQ